MHPLAIEQRANIDSCLLLLSLEIEPSPGTLIWHRPVVWGHMVSSGCNDLNKIFATKNTCISEMKCKYNELNMKHIVIFSWSIVLKILHVCEALLLRDRRPKWYCDLTTGERCLPCFCKIHASLKLSATFNSSGAFGTLRFDNTLPATPIRYYRSRIHSQVNESDAW